MKNLLVAVDDTKGSLRVVEGVIDLMKSCDSPKIILLYVQKIEGRSVMDELLLSESEMQTLKESLQGTDYQRQMDKKAQGVVDYFSKMMRDQGINPAKTIIKEGHPAEEIIKAAKEERADLIAIGSRTRRLHNLFMGSVSREVANNAETSVLLIK